MKFMSRNKKLKQTQPIKINSPFKQLRLNVELTQQQLANSIGVAVSSVRRWEKGETEPSMTVAQMRKFCQTVKRDFQDLPNSFSAKKT